MTISSVPAGAATSGPRQLKIVGNPDLVKQDPTLKLETGPWSAISWEFNSVLRALLPDAPAEPISSGLGDDKDASEEPGTNQAAEPTEATGLPNTGKAVATELSSASLGILKNTVNSWERPSQRAWYPGANLGPLNSGNDVATTTPLQALGDQDVASPMDATTPKSPAPGTSSPLPPQTPPYVRIVPRVNAPTRSPVDPKSDAVPAEQVDYQSKTTDSLAVSTPDIVPVAQPATTSVNNLSDSKATGPVSGNVTVLEKESETKPVPPTPALIRNSVSTSAIIVPISIHSGTWQIAARQNAVSHPFNAARASVRTADVQVKPGLEVPTSKTALPAITLGGSDSLPSDATPKDTESATGAEKQPGAKTASLPANVIPTPEVASAAALTRVDSEPAAKNANEPPDHTPASTPTVVSSRPLPQLDPKAFKPSQREKSPLRNSSPVVHTLPNSIARTPEKHDEERPESNPAGLFSVQETKATAVTTTEPQAPPPPSVGKPAVAVELFVVPESTGKGDQPSPNDSVVAFTGRLTPKSATQEPASRPTPDHSTEARQEKPPVSAAREIQEATADRPVHSTADVGHDHPTVRNDSGAVFSDVARDLAPASPSRPPEPVPSARSAFSEFVHEPSSRETSGPVREISMRFTDPAQDSAHLHIVEKGGEVLVSVRSGSEQLARTLSSDLGELTHRLEQTGFQTDLYRPGAQSSNSETGHGRRDSASDAGQNANQSWSRERRDSQQHSGQQSQEWIDDFEESMGLS